MAVAIPVEDGRHFVTVAVPGVDPDKAALQSGDGASSDGAAKVFVDPVSRLVVFKVEGAAAAGAMSLRSPAPLGAGFSLQGPGGLRGTTLDWVKQVDGKILPLALLKVHYGGRPPAPGTPLLDGSGNLVAIAYTAAGESDGYALPAEVAKHVVEAVIRDGAVAKARLGLTLLPSNAKPQIARVLVDSPASRAGLQVGDVLSEIGGRRIGDYADAVNAFYFLRPASTVSIKLLRAGQPVAVSLTPESGAK
ncbi:MAG: peptidase and chymotrypsin/Hap [Akkermansiaceae bacterium]|nr:peptidase and chymotrypsin/Hap [Akkermansiaceae bacterium]